MDQDRNSLEDNTPTPSESNSASSENAQQMAANSQQQGAAQMQNQYHANAANPTQNSNQQNTYNKPPLNTPFQNNYNANNYQQYDYQNDNNQPQNNYGGYSYQQYGNNPPGQQVPYINVNYTPPNSAYVPDKYGYSGDPRFSPLSPWAYFGYSLLFSIPLVGFVCLIIFSCSNENINRRNYARSFWCMLLLVVPAILILIVAGLLVFKAPIKAVTTPYY